MQKLIVIVGPTASGKTKLAVNLARKFGGEIVSADSRQVYRGMDVGTGKDLAAYRGGVHGKSLALSRSTKLSFDRPVPYHLIDVVSPRTSFTLAQYQKRAYQAINDILRRGKVPILVGGTGLYVQAVVDGYVLPEAPPDPVLRARLAKLSLSALRAKLKKLDPATYRAIDKHNRRRLERAIEICLVSGVPLSAQRVKHAPPYDVLMLGLAAPKAELHRRIDKRLKERLKQGMVPPLARGGMVPPFAKGGMVEEVRRLHRQGVSWKRLESFGLEYRYVARYLQDLKKIQNLKTVDNANSVDRPSLRYRKMGQCGEHREHGEYGEYEKYGKILYAKMVKELSAAIKDFARRQMNWFKRDKRIVWVGTRPNFRSAKTSVGQVKKEAERLAREFLKI